MSTNTILFLFGCIVFLVPAALAIYFSDGGSYKKQCKIADKIIKNLKCIKDNNERMLTIKEEQIDTKKEQLQIQAYKLMNQRTTIRKLEATSLNLQCVLDNNERALEHIPPPGDKGRDEYIERIRKELKLLNVKHEQ